MRIVILLLLVPAIAFSAPTVTDKEIVLGDQIYFDVGKATIKSQSFALLDQVAALMNKDKKIGLVEIQVHTDARGNDEWNMTMSQKRAQAIYEYLVKKGVSANRLRAKGYGETQPIDKGSDEKAWARNRRTQLVILQRGTA